MAAVAPDSAGPAGAADRAGFAIANCDNARVGVAGRGGSGTGDRPVWDCAAVRIDAATVWATLFPWLAAVAPASAGSAGPSDRAGGLASHTIGTMAGAVASEATRGVPRVSSTPAPIAPATRRVSQNQSRPVHPVNISRSRDPGFRLMHDPLGRRTAQVASNGAHRNATEPVLRARNRPTRRGRGLYHCPAASRRVSTCEPEPTEINELGQPRARVGGWADRSALLFRPRIVITASGVIYTSEPLLVATRCVEPELADVQTGSVHRRWLRKPARPCSARTTE